MKINLALVIAIIVAVGLVALGFTAYQISSERQELNNELESKTVSDGNEFFLRYLSALSATDTISLENADSIISKFSFEGVAIYYNSDSIEPLNKATTVFLDDSKDHITQTIAADTSSTRFLKKNQKDLFEYI